ncbi:hypothetical protein [Fischerella thermalis]|uniref:hypothetical protein n=1 Tax=Fischerella thermalis TaxID=372787 RepID=UPI0015E0A830|nr:hypothetical protein [Fischerella thermalis]
MIISDLNHIETVESNQVISGGCGHRKKNRNVAVAVAIAVAGDRKKDYEDYKDDYYK